MEVVASLSQGRTAAAQCGLFTHKSVPVIFEPPCICKNESQGATKNRHNIIGAVCYVIAPVNIRKYSIKISLRN